MDGSDALSVGLIFDAQISTLLSAAAPYLIGSGLLVLSAIAWAIYALAQKQVLTVLSSGQIMWLFIAVVLCYFYL